MRNKAVDVDRLHLTDAVDAKHCLRVICRIPRGVKNDCTVGAHKIHAKASCFGGDKEEARSRVLLVVEALDVALAILEFDATVKPEVILPDAPMAESNSADGHVQRILCGTNAFRFFRALRRVAQEDLDKVEGDKALGENHHLVADLLAQFEQPHQKAQFAAQIHFVPNRFLVANHLAPPIRVILLFRGRSFSRLVFFSDEPENLPLL